MLGDDPRLDGTVIQTVGSKGWDGFALARVAVLAARAWPAGRGGPGANPRQARGKC